MLRRNLLIGGLVAGAFVLPTLAQAGVVTGACVSCHTMHASQNGAVIAGAPNAQLLLGSGCVGCHTGSSNGAVTGKGGTFNAPQISDNVNVLSGGYMLVAAAPATVHNIVDGAYFTTAENNMAIGTIPGTGGTRAGSVTTAGFTCSDCHNASGGHHGTAATNYRLLQDVTGQAGQTDYGVQPVGTANGNGDRETNVYNATTMNAFCASCHGGFHGTGNQVAAGAFIRHPTDVSVNAANGPSIMTITQTTDTDQTPVGRSNAGAADHVMCLSCHVPHGSARADLLSFSYDSANNAAGGTTKSIGCETCHSYGATGM